MPSYRRSRALSLARNSGLSLLVLLAGSLPTVVVAQTTTPAVSTIAAFSGSTPASTIIKGPDGALYGTSTSNSAVTGGLIYRSTVDGSSVTTVYQLGRQDGISPLGSVLLASDGNLYGVTKFSRSGTVGSAGTVFRVGIDGTGYTTIHTFATTTSTNPASSPINADGAYPEAELIEGSDGYLYSVAVAGGANGTGTIYKISRDGTDFKVLHEFGPITSTAGVTPTLNADGLSPVAPLVQGADGYLYGTASVGGTNGRGTIFRIAFDGTGFQLLHTFPAATEDSTTKVLKNTDGIIPLAGLTDGGDGLLYGAASQGGASGDGTLFSITPDGGTFTVLHTFDGTNGQRPSGELLLASDGKLYGTTAAGGTTSTGAASTYGTLFSIARDGTGFTRLYSFDNVEGSGPAGKLLQLSDTVFVGIAATGGKCGQGTIFRYSATGDTVTGNTKCGYKKKQNGYGSNEPAILLLLGGLALRRRRR